jgi:hypothetical protein
MGFRPPPLNVPGSEAGSGIGKGKIKRLLPGFCAALIVCFSACSAFPSHERKIRHISDELSENLPRTIENKTKADSSLSVSGNYVIFIYSLRDETTGELSPDDVLRLRAELTAKLKGHFPAFSHPKDSVEGGFMFHYICMDKNGVVLFDIEMPPSKYL